MTLVLYMKRKGEETKPLRVACACILFSLSSTHRIKSCLLLWPGDRICFCTFILELLKLPKQQCKYSCSKQGEPDGRVATVIFASLSKYLADP